MTKRITIVHGIHYQGGKWMDYLVKRFTEAGWEARKWTYGYAYALLTRFQNPGRAQTLADMVRPGEVLLGHSNGGTLVYMAAELGAPLGGAILLNPALDSDKALAKQVPWVNLYANHFDEAVPLARAFVDHPWGAQGRDGLTIPDPRYRIVFTDEPTPGLPKVIGHSDIHTPEKLEKWATRIIADAEARLKE